MVLAFWLVLPDSFRANESSDYVGAYEPAARSLLAGAWPRDPDGSPATRYPPGYPVVLAGVFWLARVTCVAEASALRGAILLLAVAGAVLLYLAARALWSPPLALVVALLWATYPLHLWLTKQPNSEVVFVVPLFAAMALFLGAMTAKELSAPRFLAVGLLLGVAMLVRPIAIGLGFLLAILVPVVTPRSTHWSRTVFGTLILAGNLLAVAPWEGWVLFKTGRVIMLSSGSVYSVRDGLTAGAVDKGFREGAYFPTAARELMRRVAARAGRVRSTGEVLRVLAEESRQRPLGLVQLLAMKAARSWYGTDSNRLELAVLGVQLPYLALLALAGLRSWQLGGTARKMALVSAASLLYFWAMDVLVLSIARYIVPAVGIGLLAVPSLWRCARSSAGRGSSGDYGGEGLLCTKAIGDRPRAPQWP